MVNQINRDHHVLSREAAVKAEAYHISPEDARAGHVDQLGPELPPLGLVALHLDWEVADSSPGQPARQSLITSPVNVARR